jgi:hypothetical protein
MALIIEDGSIVADASSYVTLDEARAFALARGITLPADDASLEVLVIKTMDWLESMRAKYQGVKVSETQELQFPRVGVVAEGFEVAETAIPTLLKKAQNQAIMDMFAGLDPLVSSDGTAQVLREKVDVIETQYAEGQGNGLVPFLRKATNFLAPLLNGSGAGLSTVTRV